MSDDPMIRMLLSRPETAPMILQLLAAQGQQSPFVQATRQLQLTPQEQYLYQYHLKNLSGTGKVVHPSGDVSTIFQVPYEGPGGQFYNIPTVWDGKILQPDQAAERAAQVGWDKWPAYPTEDAAESRYQAMHEYLGQDVAKWLKDTPSAPKGGGG